MTGTSTRWSFITCSTLVAATLVLCIMSPKGIDGVLATMALASLISPVLAFQSLSFAIVIKYLNPQLASYGPISGLLFWVVLLAGTGRLLVVARAAALPLLMPVWAFGLIALALSCVVSPAVAISIMKALTFLLVTTAVLAGAQSLSESDLHRIRSFLFALVFIVALGSAVTIAYPSLGYFLVATNLQGLLNHPQTLSTFLAPFVAWAITDLLATRRVSPLVLTFLGLTCAVMLMTLARTAVIANIVGVGCALLCRTMSRKSSAQLASIGRTVALSGLAIVTIVVLACTMTSFRSAVTGFILKREAENVDQAFYSSRGFGIQSQWRNFLNQPLTGHGFGVYADGSFPDGLVEFNGIPISAPVEKGFIPTAILEETGIVGAILFWVMIAVIARYVLRASDIRWVAMFFTALTVNVGEAVLLSPGGIGLHIWIVMALAAAAYRASHTPADARSLSHNASLPMQPRFSNLMS